MTTLKRVQLQAIANLFVRMTNNEDGSPKLIRSRLGYAISRSESRMKEEMAAIDVMMRPYIEYETKRMGLCQELSEKDENGEPIILEDGSYKGVKENPEWQSKIDALQVEYKEQIDEINKMLDEEVGIDFYQIDISELPETMTKQDLEILIPFIKEPQ